MSDTEDFDPLAAFVQENPPEDAFQLREMINGFSLMMNDELPEIGQSIDDVVIAEREGRKVTVDVHCPRGDGPFPILVYLHGGGWILGSPKTHRKLGFRFAEAGYLVFNVDYGLGPEHPFPAAYDDCLTAVGWVRENAAEYGGDPHRIAVGGDSAGGNLTAAVAASETPEASAIRSILLIYPALDFATMGTELGTVPGSDINLVDLMVDAYIGHDRERLTADPRVSPIHVAEALPPAHIMCGTADGLIDDCRLLAERLASAGIRHETAFYDNMPHGFAQMEGFFPEARQSIERMVAFLDSTLASD